MKKENEVFRNSVKQRRHASAVWIVAQKQMEIYKEVIATYEAEESKLTIATKALKDIRNWNERMSFKYKDPGYRALEALNLINQKQN